MSLMTVRHSEVADLVFQNALDFLNSGLKILFDERSTASDAKISVIAIQTAIELLAKYRLVRHFGLSAIIRGSVPEGDPLTLATSGRLRTLGYGECLKLIDKDEEFSDSEREMLEGVQQLRNSLAHFAADVEVGNVRLELSWLLVSALGMFAAGTDRDYGEMETHARFLNKANFDRLICFKPYRAQAVDIANDSPDTIEVFRCWECKEDSLALRHSENYFCHCCGLAAVTLAAGFADCQHCNRANGVCYDRLNSNEGFHHGKCLFCNKTAAVPCRFWGIKRGNQRPLDAANCIDCGAVGSEAS